jgi:DNA-binding MarR family transcriptional regulator
MFNPLTRAILLVEEFRKIDPEMPMQVALVFLQIAKKPGVNLRELVATTGLGKSSMSRIVALLSKEFGKGLVTYREDLADRRNKVIHLTPDGDRTLRSVLHLIQPEEDETNGNATAR